MSDDNDSILGTVEEANDVEPDIGQMGSNSAGKFRSIIAKIERLESEKAELAADKRDIYAEMKTFGLDTKVMRKLIAIRKQDENERAEMEALLDLYLEASDGA